MAAAALSVAAVEVQAVGAAVVFQLGFPIWFNALYSTNTTGVAVAVPVTNTAVAVTNGLFTTVVDFGLTLVAPSAVSCR